MQTKSSHSFIPALLWCAMATAGCRDRDATTDAVAPTTEDVAEHPNRFLGQKLTLVGEVDEVFSDRAFELEGNDVLFDDELLVLTKSPVQLAGRSLKDDDFVMVRGTVRAFVVTDLERDLAWDLSPELEVRWREKTALIADSVSLVGESARWTEKEKNHLIGLVSIYYAPEPTQLAGQPISLAAVKVQDKAGEDALWVGENEQNSVLVVPNETAKLPDVADGARVAIEGTVRRMPEPDEAARKFELNDSDKQRAGEQTLYVEATRIEKSRGS